MNDINVERLLDQMRILSEQAGLRDTKAVGYSKDNEEINFQSVLKNALDKVNFEQQNASEIANAFEKGEGNADLAQVMIQMQKARVSFEALTQVRNRLISAYHEIMNMQV